jgi:DAK2 domain fusion protein YloV
MAEKAAEYDSSNDITLFLKYIVKEGNKILAETTDMLPQLKMANVVDAGGKGLMVIMEGALYYLENGSIVPCKENIKAKEKKEAKVQEQEEIKFGYCTEFIINKKETEMNWQKLKSKLEKIGDCVVVVDDFDIIKVHVHTNNPGVALEEAIKYGSLINIKIDNMREQAHNETVVNEQPKQEMPKIKNAFITVSAGEGLSQMFTELGCTGIITGGQTMNPSTEDFMSEIEKINAENIFILPNNKNIIMAAQQAVDITDKNVVVIKTRSIVQGIAAMIAYDEEASFEENTEAMNSAIEEITSASVTFAARDCVLDELEIKENDVMGLIEGKINLIGNSPEKVCKEIVQRLVNDETSSISIYRGEDAKEDLADALLEELEALYPDLDVNIYYGGQPLYYYYISAE